MEQVQRFLQLSGSEASDYLISEVMERGRLKTFHKDMSTYLKNKDKVIVKYIYMITFTLSDKKHYDKAKEYIYRQHERKALKILHYHVVEELTKKGIPHWHTAVESEKPLKKDRFNFYTKTYGFVDLSRTKAQTIDSCLNYMSKSNTIKQLL